MACAFVAVVEVLGVPGELFAHDGWYAVFAAFEKDMNINTLKLLIKDLLNLSRLLDNISITNTQIINALNKMDSELNNDNMKLIKEQLNIEITARIDAQVCF